MAWDGPPRTLLSQGAEARVYESTLLGHPAILKERFAKHYRHADLDARLNAQRVQQEARTLARARRVGLPVPAVLLVEAKALRLWLERAAGSTLKVFLDAHASKEVALGVAQALGSLLAAMHAQEVIHGDLTTSNVLVDEHGGLTLIDFGLASQSAQAEDKAVDLYVLERAFAATHPHAGNVLAAVLASYGAADASAQDVLVRLEAVRQRGRKKLAFG